MKFTTNLCLSYLENDLTPNLVVSKDTAKLILKEIGEFIEKGNEVARINNEMCINLENKERDLRAALKVANSNNQTIKENLNDAHSEGDLLRVSEKILKTENIHLGNRLTAQLALNKTLSEERDEGIKKNTALSAQVTRVQGYHEVVQEKLEQVQAELKEVKVDHLCNVSHLEVIAQVRQERDDTASRLVAASLALTRSENEKSIAVNGLTKHKVLSGARLDEINRLKSLMETPCTFTFGEIRLQGSVSAVDKMNKAVGVITRLEGHCFYGSEEDTGWLCDYTNRLERIKAEHTKPKYNDSVTYSGDTLYGTTEACDSLRRVLNNTAKRSSRLLEDAYLPQPIRLYCDDENNKKLATYRTVLKDRIIELENELTTRNSSTRVTCDGVGTVEFFGTPGNLHALNKTIRELRNSVGKETFNFDRFTVQGTRESIEAIKAIYEDCLANRDTVLYAGRMLYGTPSNCDFFKKLLSDHSERGAALLKDPYIEEGFKVFATAVNQTKLYNYRTKLLNRIKELEKQLINCRSVAVPNIVDCVSTFYILNDPTIKDGKTILTGLIHCRRKVELSIDACKAIGLYVDELTKESILFSNFKRDINDVVEKREYE